MKIDLEIGFHNLESTLPFAVFQGFDHISLYTLSYTICILPTFINHLYYNTFYEYNHVVLVVSGG